MINYFLLKSIIFKLKLPVTYAYKKTAVPFNGMQERYDCGHLRSQNKMGMEKCIRK